MQNVVAIFIDQTNIPLTIISDYANYNNSIYNTNFEQNVKVEYLDNVILSDRMDLNFNENFISIYGNVKYESLKGIITTDNIKIDLITKKIEIYMYNEKQKVIAEGSMRKTNASDLWDDPIVTQITKLDNYSDAEDYHKNYYNDNSSQPYCVYVIKPKLDKLEKEGIIE